MCIRDRHDTVIPGEKVPTVPPIREGYNFLHWTDDLTTKAEYNFTQKITADVKLYPVWTRNQVTITWPLIVPAGVTLTHQGTGNLADTVTSVDVGTEVTLQIVLENAMRSVRSRRATASLARRSMATSIHIPSLRTRI